MRRVWVALLFAVSGGLCGRAELARAQSIETPAPFDSAHRILAITPGLAERLRLGAPAWPVQGTTYREARLYAVAPSGGFVLVVQRVSGEMERYALTDAARGALRSLVDAGVTLGGRPNADVSADIVSEPAGNAFARHQTFLAAAVYAPLAASLVDNPAGAGAVYLATTGLSFFISYGASQSTPFTRAQSDLSGTLGLTAGGAGFLLSYAASNSTDRGVRAISLGSAVVGTVAGVALGSSMTDAEAHSAKFGIESAAAAGLMVAGFSNSSNRGMAAAAALSGIVGYPIGVRYPRRASYTVTAGDVEATSTAALIGVLGAGAIAGSIDNASNAQVAGILSAGYLAGGLIGDLSLARTYNFSQAQATVINIGALAGAVMGAAIPVLARSENAAANYGVPALGAVLGTAIVAGGMPTVAEGAVAANRGAANSRFRLVLQPLSLAAVAGGVAGHHVLVRLTF